MIPRWYENRCAGTCPGITAAFTSAPVAAPEIR
jgi:hypothetical protein